MPADAPVTTTTAPFSSTDGSRTRVGLHCLHLHRLL